MSIIFIEGFDFYGDGINTKLEQSVLVRREMWRSTRDVKDTLLFEARNGGNAISLESVNEDNSVTEPRFLHLLSQNFTPTDNLVVGLAFKFTGNVDQGGDIGQTLTYGFPLIEVCATDGESLPAYTVDIYRDVQSVDVDADIRLLRYQYQVLAGPVGNLDPNIWHYLELHLDRTGSPTTRARVYLNGGIVIDETFTEAAPGDASFGCIQLGARKRNGPSCDPVYIDDLVLLDLTDASQGPVFQDRIGPVSIRPMPATADSTALSEWTALGGGSKFSEIDEQPGENDLEASYISTDEAPRRQLFKVSMPHDIGTNILAVTSFAVVKQPDPTKGLGKLSFQTREGATDQVDTWQQPLQQVFRMASQNYVQLANGGTLTPANIQAAEWGVRSEEG